MEPVLFFKELLMSYGLILKGALITVEISAQAIIYGTVTGLIIGKWQRLSRLFSGDQIVRVSCGGSGRVSIFQTNNRRLITAPHTGTMGHPYVSPMFSRQFCEQV